MTDHKDLNEMFVSSILKLLFLRKGYSVSEEERIDGKRYDLVFSKKGMHSAQIVVIELKQYKKNSSLKLPKALPTAMFSGAPIEHHIVFIKNGNEVVTDSKLAEIIGAGDDLKVSVY